MSQRNNSNNRMLTPPKSIKNMSLTAHGLGKPPSEPRTANSRNVTFGIHKKQAFHGTWPWKTACESLEQQQDSCPKHAKHNPEILSERHLSTTLKHSLNFTFGIHKKHVSHMAVENRLRKPRTASGSCPEHAKHNPEILSERHLSTTLKHSLNVTFGIHKKHVSHMAVENRLRKPRTASGSCPEHAKHNPETLSERHLPSKTCLSRHMALENRLRKPRTAAAFVPEACKTQA